MHNLNPHQLPALMRAAQEAALSDAAKERLQWIVHFVEHQGSMRETCRRFGISRTTLHRWLERFDPTDLSTLEEGTHAPHAVRQPTVSAEVVALIRAYRERSPMMGKEVIARLLQREHGVEISASGVGRVIERECLYFGNTPLHWRKRLEYGQVVTEEVRPAAEGVTPKAPEPAASKGWMRTAMVAGMVLQGLAASLAIAVLWRMYEKPAAIEASLIGVESREETPSVVIPHE